MIISERLAEFGKLAAELNLPTTPEIAKESRDEFLSLVKPIPPSVMSEIDIQLGHGKLYSAVYGFDSACIIRKGDVQRFLARTLNTPGSNFRVIDKEETSYASLINLRSAERIISFNPDIFPRGQPAPRRWTIENVNILSVTQMGLLSGIPKTSVIDFDLWANFKHSNESGVYDKQTLLTDQVLLHTGKLSETEFEQRARKGLARQLSAKGIEKIVKACKIIANAPIDFRAILFTEEDVKIRSLTLQFLQYLQDHPDFTLEGALTPN